MKFALFFILLTFAGVRASADYTEITNANMVCESSGAAYFFDFDEDSLEPAAIWQAGTANDEEGFRLVRVTAEKLSCDFCYDINAGLNAFGGVVPLTLKMRSEANAINLTVNVTVDEDEEFTVELDCREL